MNMKKTDEQKIQLNLAIPQHYRELLRIMAAERNLKDTKHVISSTSIASEILIAELNKIIQKDTIDATPVSV